jgi:hypothetical protein
LHLPSKQSATWWVKAREPALQGGLAPAETALWLTARWFYAVSGNCATLRLPDGSTSSSHAGGAFAEITSKITHVFRVDGTSLFRSMLRGLPTTLTSAPAAPAAKSPDPTTTSCAWLDLQQPRPSVDPLYLATLNPAAVLLTARDDEDGTIRFVRASAPVGKAVAKTLRDQALNADHHRVIRVTAKGARDVVRADPTTLRSEVLATFHRPGFEGQALAGIINSNSCWIRADVDSSDRERLEVLLVSKTGTAASPVCEELVGVDLPARQVDPTHPNPRAVEHIRAAVQVAFDPVTGVRQRLEWAIRDLLAQPGRDGWKRPETTRGAAKGLLRSATHAWLARTSEAFEQVLASDTPDDLDLWTKAAWNAARAAFDEVATPYIASARYAPRYAAARRQLTPRSMT